MMPAPRQVVIIVLAALAIPAAANGQAMDRTFQAHQKEWITRPEFTSPLVDHLPTSATVPTPRAVLGTDIGAPRVLHYYADIMKYYRALAAASSRVNIVATGKTEEGRETFCVMISSDANIANVEANRRDLAALADPRSLNDEEAKAVIHRAKPMYVVLGGLHSSETGPPEMLMELAYRLITEDSPVIQKIRDNVIVVINPATDPDGHDRYTDWYFRNKIDDTDDLAPVHNAPYWGKYIYHDNNRDINFSGLSAKNLLTFYLKWHPPIVHDLHESHPFLYTFSGQAPQNPLLDPIIYGELPWYANFEMAQLTKYGMPGVWTHGFVDMWSPGYVAFMSSNHNGLVRMYETFGNSGATTELRHVKPVPGAVEEVHRGDETIREWFRPSPPYPVVQWSMRDNTNYMESALITGLQQTAEFPEVVLENFYQKSKNAVRQGESKAPYAYVIPGDQPDMTRAAIIVNLLRQQGIEVGLTKTPVSLAEGSFPAGSILIKLNQPYGPLARTLLSKQVFPDPKLKTFDDTAWTMGLMAHVHVVETADRIALGVATEALNRYEAVGKIEGAPARTYAVLDNGSINLATLRFRLRGVAIRIAERQFTSGERIIPAGSLLIPGSAFGSLKSAVGPLGLTAVALQVDPLVPSHEAALPRIGVYSTWGFTQNVGWLRYAFDQFETPYNLLFKEDLTGDLHKKYDLIIIPSQGRTGKDLVFDIPVYGKPLSYTKTTRFKFLGDYGSSADIRGGMGLGGLETLRKFASEGGTLITLGEASAVPAEFGLTPDVEVQRPTPAFYAPGPIVTANVAVPTNPIFYGYSQVSMPVRWASTVLLDVPLRAKTNILMTFPGGDKNVLSGLMNSADEIKDRPAIVDVPLGAGQVLMFTTDPIHRWQNFGEFRMLYNALLNYKNLRIGLAAPSTSSGSRDANDPHGE